VKKRKLFWIAFALILAFSLVFAGCGDDDETEPEPDPFTVLKVTGIPADLDIMGASLMVPTVPDTPVVVGMNFPEGTTAVFKLHEPMSGMPMPDNNKPWKGEATYIVTIAEIDEEKIPTLGYEGASNPFMYIGPNFDVADYAGLLTAIAQADQQAVMQVVGGWLMQNQALAAALNPAPYSFNKNDVVTLEWKNFFPISVLNIIQTIAAMAQP